MRALSAFLLRDLKLATSYPLAFVMTLGRSLFPLLVLYLPAELMGDVASTREYGGFLPYSVIGIGTLNFFMASYGSFANSLRNEQTMGTLESILMAPLGLPMLVLASASWGLLGSVANAVVFIGGGAWLYGIPLPGNLASGLLIIVLTTLGFVGIGVLSASFTMVWKRGDPIGPLIAATFFLLGGIIYPPKILPSWLSFLSPLLPVTHGVEALRQVLLQGHTLADVRMHVIVLAVFAAVSLPASLLAFGLAVRKATRDGTLLQF